MGQEGKKFFLKEHLFFGIPSHLPLLQNLPRNPGASLGIGQSVMMVDEVVAAGRRHSMKLVIGQQFSKVFARGATGAIKLIVRVIHLVAAHHSLEAAFVEGTVVRHQGQALDKRLNLPPDVRKHGRVLGVGLRDAVDHRVPIKIIIWLGLDEGIERVHELPFPNNHHADAAHAGALVVGGLKVYGSEGVHFSKIMEPA